MSLFNTTQQYCDAAKRFVEYSDPIFNYQYSDMQNNTEIYSFGLLKQAPRPLIQL